MTAQELIIFRKSLKCTQQQLAEKLGVKQQRISAWERGERKIPLYIEKHIECIKRIK